MLIHIKMKIGENYFDKAMDVFDDATTEEKHEAVNTLMFDVLEVVYTELGLVSKMTFEDEVLQK